MKREMIMKTSRYLILARIVRTDKLDMKGNPIIHSSSIQGLIKSGIVQPIYKKHQLESINITPQGCKFLESIIMNKHSLQYRHNYRLKGAIKIFILVLLVFIDALLINCSIRLSSINMILLFSFIEILLFAYSLYVAHQSTKFHIIPTITKNQFFSQVQHTDGISWNEDLIDLFEIE